MNKEISKKTALVAQMSSMLLDAQLNTLKDTLDEEEFKEIRSKFAKPMGYIYFEILAPIWDKYPELLPDKMGGTYKISDDMYNDLYAVVNKYA